MPFIASMAGNYGYGRPARAPTGGSLRFTAASTSGISIPNDADFQLGTGDFTIEWFQYQLTGSGTNQRIFSIGSYPSTSIAVSQEGSDISKTFYAWLSGANNIASGLNLTNAWIHFAITRSGTSLRVFQNGTQIGTTLTNSTNFNNNTQAFEIGNETTQSAGAAFNGYITNFHWVKGTALYTANFSKPTRPITAVANTKLLLNATTSGTAFTDSSGLGKVSTPTGVAWNALTPF
jgi:Concanavalin A-like lectin/glucanases superfamily